MYVLKQRDYSYKLNLLNRPNAYQKHDIFIKLKQLNVLAFN